MSKITEAQYTILASDSKEGFGRSGEKEVGRGEYLHPMGVSLMTLIPGTRHAGLTIHPALRSSSRSLRAQPHLDENDLLEAGLTRVVQYRLMGGKVGSAMLSHFHRPITYHQYKELVNSLE